MSAGLQLSQAARSDPEAMVGVLQCHHVSRLVIVPSVLHAVMAVVPNLGESLPNLRILSVSGEALTTSLCKYASVRGRVAPAGLFTILCKSHSICAEPCLRLPHV
jgi:acyl-coenzyme A synthetase/AMP-(fatty) acid ligase